MLKKTLLLAVLAAVAIPGTAAARSGVVVKVDRASALTAVAGAHGSVALVHAKTTAKVGQKVTFQAHARHNGTLNASGFRIVGKVTRVHIRGVVLAHRSGGYLLSAQGAVLRIGLHAGLRHTQSASDSGEPAVGATVDVTASISDDELDQEDAQPLLTDARSGAIEGHLVAGPAGTIAVRSEGLTLVLAVPAGFDVSKFKVGDEVLASFQRQADGSLTLTALSGDNEDDQGENDDSSDDGTDVSASAGVSVGSSGH